MRGGECRDVHEDVHENQSGDVHENLSGDVHENLSGDVHEDLSGDVHGIAASAEADRVAALRAVGPRRTG
ncbi:hypothetical protein [Streptomyces sp. NPDC001833]|uniref:hypothetical protein n=1 Tax=Streptomyces sp. NPDC001833 TaxID=3154658 RepID=UPI00331E70B9